MPLWNFPLNKIPLPKDRSLEYGLLNNGISGKAEGSRDKEQDIKERYKEQEGSTKITVLNTALFESFFISSAC
jgi:hypothetical protein